MNYGKKVKDYLLFGFVVTLVIWMINLVFSWIPPMYGQYAAIDLGSLSQIFSGGGIMILVKYLVGILLFGFLSIEIINKYILKMLLKVEVEVG